MTIANMAIEAGGKNARFPGGREDVRLRGRAHEAQRHEVGLHSRWTSTQDQKLRIYDQTRWSYPTSWSQLWRMHPDPGHRALAKDAGQDRSLDRAYIGSCTGGKTSDFLAFAEVLKGRSVKIDTFGVPATPDVVYELQNTMIRRHDGVGACSNRPVCR